MFNHIKLQFLPAFLAFVSVFGAAFMTFGPYGFSVPTDASLLTVGRILLCFISWILALALFQIATMKSLNQKFGFFKSFFN